MLMFGWVGSSDGANISRESVDIAGIGYTLTLCSQASVDPRRLHF